MNALSAISSLIGRDKDLQDTVWRGGSDNLRDMVETSNNDQFISQNSSSLTSILLSLKRLLRSEKKTLEKKDAISGTLSRSTK